MFCEGENQHRNRQMTSIRRVQSDGIHFREIEAMWDRQNQFDKQQMEAHMVPLTPAPEVTCEKEKKKISTSESHRGSVLSEQLNFQKNKKWRRHSKVG